MKPHIRTIAAALLSLHASVFCLAQTASRVGTLPSAEIPESIAIDTDGNCYLSIANGIRKVTTAGVVSMFATLPAGSPARPLGIKFDAAGILYAAGAGGGIVWKFSRTGEPSRWVTIAGAQLLNDLVIDGAGNVYVTDSGTNIIHKIDPAGNVQNWSADPLLKPRATPSFHPNQTIGCNGIAFGPDGAIYVSVTQPGRIVRIPINSNGSAGPAQIVAEHEMLVSTDGIAFDTNGDLYLAINTQYRVAVLKPDGRISTVAAGGELVTPTSIAFGRAGAQRSLFVCNNGHFYPEADASKTGLLRIDLGTLADSTAVRWSNFAARGNVGAGALVAGFTIEGSRSKSVLIRAVGPALSQFGVADALSDPRLDLYSGNTVIESNDNWRVPVGVVALSSSLGSFPLTAGSRDAAIMTTLRPGSYTAVVTGVGGASGVALLEIYEIQ